MVKIKDVAAKAGVSVSTVSYVINGKAEQIRISEVTQKKYGKQLKSLITGQTCRRRN
ncbi:LacI family DNA-binding transcriptional regulator [Blautia sp. RD014234]|nr:LacI family DNA-binding transcriptional regulator [Blautia parvula]